MNKYSETIGSFLRTGNFPLEANYTFKTESELLEFFDDNQSILHRGLLKVVGEGDNLSLYWVISEDSEDGDINTRFVKLISKDTLDSLRTLQENLEQESSYRAQKDSELLAHIDKFLSTIDNLDSKINTLPELQKFLEGYSDLDKLNAILNNLAKDIKGNPVKYQTLEALEQGLLATFQALKNREDNLQTELNSTQSGVGLNLDGSYSPDLETHYLKTATSVMNALKTLDAMIHRVNYEFQSSNTVNLNATTNEVTNTTTVVAEVKIAEDSDILVKEKGLYTKLDTEYENGVLTIKVNGEVRKSHDLGLSGIVNDAYYDSTIEKIVIIFNLHNGEVLRVEIPADGIITEWEVENNDEHSVLLKRTRTIDGPDFLSADVRISNDESNALTKLPSGELFVGNEDFARNYNLLLNNPNNVLGYIPKGVPNFYLNSKPKSFLLSLAYDPGRTPVAGMVHLRLNSSDLNGQRPPKRYAIATFPEVITNSGNPLKVFIVSVDSTGIGVVSINNVDQESGETYVPALPNGAEFIDGEYEDGLFLMVNGGKGINVNNNQGDVNISIDNSVITTAHTVIDSEGTNVSIIYDPDKDGPSIGLCYDDWEVFSNPVTSSVISYNSTGGHKNGASWLGGRIYTTANLNTNYKNYNNLVTGQYLHSTLNKIKTGSGLKLITGDIPTLLLLLRQQINNSVQHGNPLIVNYSGDGYYYIHLYVTDDTNSDYSTSDSLVTGKYLHNKLNNLQAGNGISITSGTEGDAPTISCTLDTEVFKVVNELPTENISKNKIYLVPSSNTPATYAVDPSLPPIEVYPYHDMYNEFIYTDENGWELIGQKQLDISNKIDSVDFEDNDIATTEEIIENVNGTLIFRITNPNIEADYSISKNIVLSDYLHENFYTKNQVDNKLFVDSVSTDIAAEASAITIADTGDASEIVLGVTYSDDSTDPDYTESKVLTTARYVYSHFVTKEEANTYDKVTPIINSTEDTLTIEPNKYYIWGEMESLNITLSEPTNNNILNEYMFEFISGETPTELTLPDSVKFGNLVKIEPNTRYQVSIINNIGVIYGV